VEAEGVKLLFDAGISGRQAEQRLAALGRDIRDVQALIISHDHADHLRCAGVFQRKYGLPLYITRRTLEAGQTQNLGRLTDKHFFRAGEQLDLGSVSIETIPTPHDGADGVAFVVEARRRRLGILTDLGHLFEGLAETVATLDAVFLESNFDPELLDRGPYPDFLKRRILGRGGHISNQEAAGLLGTAASDRLQWACLAHLSEQNNDPDLARETHRRMLADRFPLHMAGRYGASEILKVD
ncbi:MAG: MBL fold metallo-hydrolase, partial [Desulfobacterota bacterium]|jgi:phosphoribosyl 1,2-cyclic phosphodiesterase|nr:MBL fold metallo-hydrolase [Thermodesulfobacteriota bacterium]